VATLLEGDQELVGDRSSKYLPTHFYITVGGNGNGRGWRGFRQGTTQCPAAQHIPVGNLGDALEFDQLVFGSLGEFDPIEGWVHGGWVSGGVGSWGVGEF